MGFPSMGPKDANVDGSGGENTIAVNSALGNERTGESNGDAKVGSKVQPNIVTMAPVSHRPTIATDTLVPASPIPVSICRPLALVCDGRLSLSRSNFRLMCLVQSS